MNYEKLKSFLSTEVFNEEIDNLKNLNRGGSSTNFVCKTAQKKYLVKLLPASNPQRAERLSNILDSLKKIPQIYTPYIVEFNQKQLFYFEKYIVIVIEFIEGKRIKHHQLNENVLNEIFNSYQHVKDLEISTLPQINIKETYLENIKLINNLKTKHIGYFKKKILDMMYSFNEAINTDIKLESKPVVIHGDASLNNIMEDKNKKIVMLDFELMRIGYPCEDWAEFLISSLAQHSIFSFPDKKFAQLVVDVNKLMNFSKMDWQYGINVYFLRLLNKRLKAKKLFKSIRKALLFILNKNKLKIALNQIEKIY